MSSTVGRPAPVAVALDAPDLATRRRLGRAGRPARVARCKVGLELYLRDGPGAVHAVRRGQRPAGLPRPEAARHPATPSPGRPARSPAWRRPTSPCTPPGGRRWSGPPSRPCPDDAGHRGHRADLAGRRRPRARSGCAGRRCDAVRRARPCSPSAPGRARWCARRRRSPPSGPRSARDVTPDHPRRAPRRRRARPTTRPGGDPRSRPWPPAPTCSSSAADHRGRQDPAAAAAALRDRWPARRLVRRLLLVGPPTGLAVAGAELATFDPAADLRVRCRPGVAGRSVHASAELCEAPSGGPAAPDPRARAAALREGRGRPPRARRGQEPPQALGGVARRTSSARARTDDVIGKMKVSALLESMPGVGKVRARQIMERLRDRRDPPGPWAGRPTRSPPLEREFGAGR